MDIIKRHSHNWHFARALQIAKKRKNHKVYWQDIEPEIDKIIGKVKWYEAEGFNQTSTKTKALRCKQTFKDYLNDIWNSSKSFKSPYKYFEKILYPVGLDENQNIIYKYNSKKVAGKTL